MNIIVTGHRNGLGKALYDMLRGGECNGNRGHNVIGYDFLENDDVANPSDWLAEVGEVDILINCAGINHNAWFDELKRADHENVMDTNANSIVYMVKAVLPQLIASKGTVINIVSNAANMPMTSSLSYNMAKAAALMATKQLAHELTRKHGITVFSVSPNKLSGTVMSSYIESKVCEVRGWTPEFAADYQKKSLMHGLETPPEAVARMIVHLIESGDMIYMSGCDIPFGK
ncbi:3-oxoacyl-[acyl-carrier-protein] reductase [Aeromonas phage Gekk3-15]